MASQYESAADSGLQSIVIANLHTNTPESSAEALEMVESNPSEWTRRVGDDTRGEVDRRDATDGEDKSDVDDDHPHANSEDCVKEIVKELFRLVNLWIRTASKLLKPEESSASSDKAGESHEKSSSSVDKSEKMKKSWHIN